VCLLAVATWGATAAVAATQDRVVVMISVDGLAGQYLDDPKTDMPNIRALAKEGARAESMRASTPTVTWTNHTTLVTGVNPARHGVVGNNYFDRTTRKRVTLISDPVFDKDQIVHAPTIYDLAHAAGLRTAALRWPASRNAKSLDWTTPDVATLELTRRYATPALLDECEKENIHIDGAGVPGQGRGRVDVSLAQDEEFVRAARLILRDHRPNLLLLHLANTDHTQHLNGPRSPEAYAAIKEADRQVGEVWDELKRDFPGKATLIVTSDHGFSKIEHAVLPNVVLRKAGLIDVKGPRVVGGSIVLLPQGGSAMVYITDPSRRDDIVDRVKKALTGVDGILKIAGPGELKDYGVGDPKDDPHAPDMILFAKDGWIFGDTAAGALSFIEKPERKGSHGHDASIPGLHATFVAWGAGIRPGGVNVGEITNLDVAPTIAKLLGVPMPNVDGKPLDGVLAE
jgi:predicted AlkP superfamily pyrophosphatase or phosphodiesterase